MVELGRLLGCVVGETTHTRVYFTSERPLKVGEYVIIEYEVNGRRMYALGIVEKSLMGNPMLSEPGVKPEFVWRASEFGAVRHEYMVASARILSWLHTLLEKGRVEAPRYPPRPSARVYEASSTVLRRIFARSVKDGWVRIGTLADHDDVPFYVHVPSLVSRHLAILAVTGAGKSNTVAVLLNRIVKELRGTALLIDMHSEYGLIAGERTNVIKPRMHPARLSVQEYYSLLNLQPSASKQRMYLRKAYKELMSSGNALRRREEFLELLRDKVSEYYRQAGSRSAIPSSDRNSLADLIHKIEELMDRYHGTVLTPEAPDRLESVIKPGYVNILDLGSVDEEVADVVTYHYLLWLLNERKRYVVSGKGYPVPVLTVIEEAHVLVPARRETLTKGVVSRIAREGRKFGVGLVLVSQRPKNLDEDALSQTNNKIILKLVEPRDQRYVQAASETLSDEILELLPSLNTGEAVVLGLMTPLPALVKIDKAESKVGGTDIMVHEEWRRFWEEKLSKPRDFYEEMGF